MNNKQYELIGESIWNTYKNIAYIFAEAKSPKEHAADTAAKEGEAGRARDAERKRRFLALPKSNIKSWRAEEDAKKPK
jgi:hypothetical protein